MDSRVCRLLPKVLEHCEKFECIVVVIGNSMPWGIVLSEANKVKTSIWN